MKLVSYYRHDPKIQESWFINELEILQKEHIEFIVPIRNKEKTKLKFPKNNKWSKYFLYIPQFPNNIIVKILYISYFQIYVFLLFPIKYVKVLIWIILHVNRSFLRCFLRISPIISKLSRFGGEIYMSHWAFDPMVMTFLSAKFFNQPLGMVSHAIYNYLDYIRYINKSTSFIIFRSDYIRQKYMEKYPEVRKKRIDVIPCGIDTVFFRKNNRILKQIQDDDADFERARMTILSVCRFVEMKGIIYVLQACRLLKDKDIMFKYILVGYGPENRKYMNFIRKNNLQGFVKIYPPLPHSRELLNILSSADIFVLPSIIDSKGEVDVIPNACLEAMAMELPVITTRVGGMDEVITDGINGFFCRENDELDLANKIKMVMDMPEEKRKEIGRKARKVVLERFDKEKQGKKFVEFLKKQVDRE